MDIEISPVVEWLALFQPQNVLPWRVHDVEDRRARMTDVLLFDVLLIRGGIHQPDLVYPPRDADGLARLLEAIHHSTYDSLKKDCLVYILLKWYQDGRETPFYEQKCIPPQFSLLADAYWYLDAGVNVAKAVSILCDARLNRDYSSKILQALALAPNSSPLIVKYVRTAKPQLTEPDDIELYTLALAETSLPEAWRYQRSFPERSETRQRLIRKIIGWCLSPTIRGDALALFVALALTEYEQSELHAFARAPPPASTTSLSPASGIPPQSLAALHDLVVLRLVQAGSFAAAVRLDRELAASVHGASSRAGGAVARAAEERRRMLDEVLGTLPPVERRLVEADAAAAASVLAAQSSGPVLPAALPQPQPASQDLSMSMSMSWEHVPPPSAAAAVSVSANASASASASASARASPLTIISQPLAPPRERNPLNGSTSSFASLSASAAKGPRNPQELFAPPRASPSPGSKSVSASPAFGASANLGSSTRSNANANANGGGGAPAFAAFSQNFGQSISASGSSSMRPSASASASASASGAPSISAPPVGPSGLKLSFAKPSLSASTSSSFFNIGNNNSLSASANGFSYGGGGGGGGGGPRPASTSLFFDKLSGRQPPNAFYAGVGAGAGRSASPAGSSASANMNG
ncbi:hypothetical protein CONPUDRAFT_167488, partial [Coniophora puteana RWD-64-598 SS2]